MRSTLAPFTTTRRLLWGSLAGALLLSALYGYLFLALKKSSEKTAALELETASLIAQESQVGQFRKNLATADEQRQKLSSYFIDAKDIVPFLETMESYGDQTGTEVAFSTVDIKKGPNRLDVGMAVAGDFADLYRFLALVETAPYEIVINKVDLSATTPQGLTPDGDEPHTPAWNAYVTLSVMSISGVQ